MYCQGHAREDRFHFLEYGSRLEPPNFGKCKYAHLCKYRKEELPCELQEVAERYCKVYRIFQKYELKDHDQAMTA
jgi:hypothetical protein